MAEQQINAWLSEIFQSFQSEDQAVLSSYQLTPTSFTLLSLLNEVGGLRQIEIAERLLVDGSTMTRLINRLEQVGLVKRMLEPNDRRALRVVMTAEGQQRLHAARHHFENSLAQRLAVLSEAEQQRLIELLQKLAASLHIDLLRHSPTFNRSLAGHERGAEGRE